MEEGLNGEIVMSPETTWARGECNGFVGDFPTEVICILPTISQPTKKILSLFKDGAAKPRTHAAPNYNTIQRLKMYTLRRYAAENFRATIELVLNKYLGKIKLLNVSVCDFSSSRRKSTMTSARRDIEDELWRHTREPLKAPLLQKLQRHKEGFDIAVAIFTNILRVGLNPKLLSMSLSNNKKYASMYSTWVICPKENFKLTQTTYSNQPCLMKCYAMKSTVK